MSDGRTDRTAALVDQLLKITLELEELSSQRSSGTRRTFAAIANRSGQRLWHR